MIARQTGAIFLDAYRELNSKKLFWIVLFISLAIVVAMGLPGNDEKGITFFGLSLEFPFLSTKAVSRVGFYKYLFAKIGINVWLTWGATILALISTASIIPDMVTNGSIELSLSRPIGRLRFFLTKYLAGLLFVAAQVSIFSLGAFAVILLRAGKAEPSVFIAIPMVVSIYSFLFCVCALTGLLSRSALTAILVTMIFWLFLGSLSLTEQILLTQKLEKERDISRLSSQIEQISGAEAVLQARLANAKPEDRTPPAPTPVTEPGTKDASGAEQKKPPELQNRTSRRNLNDAFKQIVSAVQSTDAGEIRDRLRRQAELRAQLERDRSEAERWLAPLIRWHRGFYIAKTPLPKTSEAATLLERWVIDKSDIDGVLKMMEDAQESGSRDMNEALTKRPVWWVLGTSFGFEFVVLGIAAWIFWRRDF